MGLHKKAKKLTMKKARKRVNPEVLKAIRKKNDPLNEGIAVGKNIWDTPPGVLAARVSGLARGMAPDKMTGAIQYGSTGLGTLMSMAQMRGMMGLAGAGGGGGGAPNSADIIGLSRMLANQSQQNQVAANKIETANLKMQKETIANATQNLTRKLDSVNAEATVKKAKSELDEEQNKYEKAKQMEMTFTKLNSEEGRAEHRKKVVEKKVEVGKEEIKLNDAKQLTELDKKVFDTKDEIAIQQQVAAATKKYREDNQHSDEAIKRRQLLAAANHDLELSKGIGEVYNDQLKIARDLQIENIRKEYEIQNTKADTEALLAHVNSMRQKSFEEKQKALELEKAEDEANKRKERAEKFKEIADKNPVFASDKANASFIDYVTKGIKNSDPSVDEILNVDPNDRQAVEEEANKFSWKEYIMEQLNGMNDEFNLHINHILNRVKKDGDLKKALRQQFLSYGYTTEMRDLAENILGDEGLSYVYDRPYTVEAFKNDAKLGMRINNLNHIKWNEFQENEDGVKVLPPQHPWDHSLFRFLYQFRNNKDEDKEYLASEYEKLLWNEDYTNTVKNLIKYGGPTEENMFILSKLIGVDNLSDLNDNQFEEYGKTMKYYRDLGFGQIYNPELKFENYKAEDYRD